MGLDIIDLYDAWTTTYPTGTKDSGNGIALPSPSPGLANWLQGDSTPPNGWDECPVGTWAHGGYLYIVYDGTAGLGKGIYRFSVDANGDLTYDSFVAQASLGLVTGNWARPACCYDSVDGSVIIATYPLAGSGNTPVVGKWLCSDWPFSDVNHEWQSGVSQSYGSYVATQITDEPGLFLGSTYLFVRSDASGQVHILDPSDGSVVGNWVYYGTYNTPNAFHILGENASGNPIGGSYHADGGNKNIYAWNISNPNSWATTGGVLIADPIWGYTNGVTPHYKRGKHRLYANWTRFMPVSKHECTALGLAGCLCWTNVRSSGKTSEQHLVHYDPATDEYRECAIAPTSARRAVGNSSFFNTHMWHFLVINSIPWLLSWGELSEDQEEEDPGGNITTHHGICLTPIGPGVAKFTKTLSATTTPRRIMPTIPVAAKNYLFSTHWAKHGVRHRVNAGAWSDWRYGEQELTNLDSIVNGKAAWPSWSVGDAIEIEWRLSSGWPQALDATCYQNPGAVGDPSQLPTCTADVGPPREVRPMLFVDGSAVVYTITGIEATAAYEDEIGASVEVDQ